MFYRCFNTIVTRCFGWGLPRTSMIPFADCINHHNVDSTYEYICQELHEPIAHLHSSNSTYTQNLEELKQELEIENTDDQTYYTKSKMLIDISDL